MTRAPAAAASARSPAGAAAPPSRIARNPASTSRPPGSSSRRRTWVGTSDTYSGAQRGGGGRVQLLQDHRRDAGQQRAQEHLQPGDVTRRQAGQPGLAGPGADPGQAGPRRMGERRRAQLGAFRLAGGPGGGDHDRGPRGQRGGVTPVKPLRAVQGFQGGGAERLEQGRNPLGGQPGIDGQDGRPGSVQGGAERLHQPVCPLGRGEQHCVQRAGGHRRKVIRADQG